MRRLRSARFHLEPLEDRTAPAASVFSSDADVAIRDNRTVSSPLRVGDSFFVGDVDVALDIDHGYDGDLTVSLVSPDGHEIVLIAGVGADSAGFDVTLDGEAADSIASVTLPGSAITGTF